MRRVVSTAGVAALLGAGSAQAAGPAVERPLWEIGVGAAALRLPHYRGSDQSRNWLLPLPVLVYRGEILRADRDGARAVLLDRAGVELDVSLNASPPTRSRDNRARGGMDDLEPTFEVGPRLKLGLGRGDGWQLGLLLPVRAVMTLQSSPRHLGWSANPHLALDLRGPADWNLGVQAGPVYGSRRLHGYYYGVEAGDARPGRPAYRAPAGYGGALLQATAARRFGHHWIGAFVRADTVSGARFESSPLVRRNGSLWFGVAWTWMLAQSSTSVRVDE